MFPLLWQYKDEVKTMAQAFFGGVHPNDMKAATNEKAIEQLQAPAQVVIPMSMHFGAPCTPTVSKGDYVKLGQKIGEFKGLGAPIHASVSGTVAAVEPRPYSMGGKVMSVVIDNDFKDDLSEEVHAPADPDALSVEEMVEMVKQAGIVGMGGATFPTHTKISSGIGKVDTVIINGAECEPYITGDHRAMLERPAEIIGGCCYLAKMFGVSKVVIGVEDNKKNGIEALNKVIAEQKAPVVVESLRCRYPQGGEKQLCQAITGKQVPPGGLPANIGCAVFNINTTIAIYHAIKDGMPVVRKIVTVSGSGVVEPKNLECPIGTPISNVKDLATSFKEAQIAMEVSKVFDTEKQIIRYDNLGIARLIYQLPTTVCEMFLREVFKQGSIESLDQETLFTIQRFFENNLNVSETSRGLFVHRNTLVYRLEKIKKLTGLDLREFDDAIVFKVALMVKKYLSNNPAKY